MNGIINILKTDEFLIAIAVMNILILLGLIILLLKYVGLNKRYKNFMRKLGKSENIEEDLETFMYRVDKVEKENSEIKHLINIVDEDVRNCIQKVGIVRYSAFKDTGSDLSFALALLDEKNNGVVLNGIYSREMSNIYAKPVENGKSTYTISKEEEEAIKKAMEKESNIRI